MTVEEIKTLNDLKKHLTMDLMLPSIELILPAIDLAYWFGRNDAAVIYGEAIRDAANNA